MQLWRLPEWASVACGEGSGTGMGDPRESEPRPHGDGIGAGPGYQMPDYGLPIDPQGRGSGHGWGARPCDAKVSPL